ncbi:hypothetical protein [Kozakia baliensis]|nr:hypothetical protein [Kozakia baliensis]
MVIESSLSISASCPKGGIMAGVVQPEMPLSFIADGKEADENKDS